VSQLRRLGRRLPNRRDDAAGAGEIMAGHLLFVAFRCSARARCSSRCGCVRRRCRMVGARGAACRASHRPRLRPLRAAWRSVCARCQNADRLPLRADADVHVLRTSSRSASCRAAFGSSHPRCVSQGVALCRSLSLGTASASGVAGAARYLLAFVVGIAVARVTTVAAARMIATGWTRQRTGRPRRRNALIPTAVAGDRRFRASSSRCSTCSRIALRRHCFVARCRVDVRYAAFRRAGDSWPPRL